MRPLRSRGTANGFPRSGRGEIRRCRGPPHCAGPSRRPRGTPGNPHRRSTQRGPLPSADPRQLVPHGVVDGAQSPGEGAHPDAGCPFLHLADDRGFPSERVFPQGGEARPPHPGATISSAFPSFARYSGSKPRISQTPRTDSRTEAGLFEEEPGLRGRRHLVERHADAAARGVAHEPHPAAEPLEQGKDTRRRGPRPTGRGRNGKASAGPPSRPRNGPPSSPKGGSGRRDGPPGRGLQPSTSTPTPAVLMKIPSPFPLLHDLRVAAGDDDPGLLRRVPHRRQRPFERLDRKSLLEHQPAGDRDPLAPQTARSFTVPQTASRPMSPPGKKGGVTTYPSVVKAISPSIRPSSPASKNGEARGC